jgi:hypothetical protein
MTLGKHCAEGRSRNLDALRLMLAAAVVVSHAWPLALGAGHGRALAALTGHALGGWAVGLFFFLSGLLVTGERRAPRRACVLGRAGAADRAGAGHGPAGHACPGLASGAAPGPGEAIGVVPRAHALLHRAPHDRAPSPATPIRRCVNGPLWSLFHEVTAYAVCALFVACGGARRRGPCWASSVSPRWPPPWPKRFRGGRRPLRRSSSPSRWGWPPMSPRPDRSPPGRLRSSPAAGACPALAAGRRLCSAMSALAISLRAPQMRRRGDFSYGSTSTAGRWRRRSYTCSPASAPARWPSLASPERWPVAIASWHAVERPPPPRRGRVA